MDGRRLTAAALPSLDLPRGLNVLAWGKAGPAMLAGALDGAGDRIERALCIARPGDLRGDEPLPPGTAFIEGDHPLPGEGSLRAGRAIEAFCDALQPGDHLLCLLSGGASALAESLPEGVDAGDLARANRWLLASGLSIADVNALRSQLSCLKAGRLAQRLAGREVDVLALSDVSSDDPAVIGSGPFSPRAPQSAPDGLPDWFMALMDKAPPPPEPGAPGLSTVRYHVLGNAETAARAAVEAARSLGVEGVVHLPRIDGETEATARRILAELEQGPEGLHAWAGETTVRLPPSPGQGGRARHLALCLALAIAGRSDRLFLCAGTDAGDGPGDVAGGWADGTTLRRGVVAGRDARCDLAAADSGRFLAAAGDEFVTGPTGTNVTDLVLAWKGTGGLSSTGDRG